MKRHPGLFFVIVFVFICCTNSPEIPEITGDYLGQNFPGETPELFAPGILSTLHHEHSAPAFSPDGNEVYWSAFFYFRMPQVILFSRNTGGKWSRPEVAVFSGQYADGNPVFSNDGSRIFFSSNRPLNGTGIPKDDFDIWYVDKTDNGWSLPERLTNIINTELNEDHPSVSANGNIYFHSERENTFGRFDIYMSEYSNGEYSEPVNLGESINTPAYDSYPYIAPDESYIIFCSNMEGSYGAGDLYISFRKEDGSWTKARNLDRGINESSDDRFPQVSTDGKYLFFVSNRQSTPTYFEEKKSYDEMISILGRPGNGYGDIYWVDAGIIETLKNEMLDK